MKNKTIKPQRLLAGDNIGLIAPGSPIDKNRLETAKKNLKSLGFNPVYTDNILAKNGYLAGSDKQRLDDLHQMFSDDSIKGIWCIRGGYGCTRLLPKIDYKLIKKNPKVLIGYSDITALLSAIYKKTGLIGFHGPVGVSEQNNYTKDMFRKVLMEPKSTMLLANAATNLNHSDKAFHFQTITSGKAKGKLIGGNLSLLAAMCGTKRLSSFKKKIVLIEDIGEKPYRIDRMLTQLRQSTDLKKAAAIVLGVFADCEGDKNSLTLHQVFENRLGDLGIPVVYGMSFGHIDFQMTLPIGIKAKINADTGHLNLLETAVK